MPRIAPVCARLEQLGTPWLGNRGTGRAQREIRKRCHRSLEGNARVHDWGIRSLIGAIMPFELPPSIQVKHCLSKTRRLQGEPRAKTQCGSVVREEGSQADELRLVCLGGRPLRERCHDDDHLGESEQREEGLVSCAEPDEQYSSCEIDPVTAPEVLDLF